MKSLYYILISSILIISCSEDIDLTLNSSKPTLVVDGHIFDTISDLNYVRLTMSTNYFSNAPSPGVSGATVVVSDGLDEYYFTERDSAGLYYAPILFAAQHNCTYTLTISDVDTNGDGVNETYTALSTTPPTYEVDSVQCTYDKFMDAYKVGLYAYEDTMTQNYYMFGVAINDSLISNTYTNMSLTTDKWFSTNYCWGATIYIFSDENIKGRDVCLGDKITTHVMSINEDFYNYVEAMGDIVNGSNPMFSSTPSNAVGNINGGALGFFTVIAIKSKDCYITEVGDMDKK